MTPAALEKLYRRSKGRVPLLDPRHYEELLLLAKEHVDPASGVRFWGLVDSCKRLSATESVLHCFNFGNQSVAFPWAAELVSFGGRLPVRVSGSGTILAKKTYRTPLQQVESPFLVFRCGDPALVEEHVENGMLVCDSGSAASAKSVTEVEVAAPSSQSIPAGETSAWLWLYKRLEVTVQKLGEAEYLANDGSIHRLQRARVVFQRPVLVDRGWLIPLYDGRRAAWSIVTALVTAV